MLGWVADSRTIGSGLGSFQYQEVKLVAVNARPVIHSFDDYQAQARKTAVYPQHGHNPYYPALGLAGESGEFCNTLKKVMRDEAGVITDEKRAKLASELGDVLWYLSACAEEIGVSLVEIACANVDKLHARQVRGTLHGSGENR